MNYIYKYPLKKIGVLMKKFSLVLIEDDADDVDILTDALDMNDIQYEITWLKDGSAAVSFFENSEMLPDIIVMDFNLPRVHGRELVNFIRSRKRLDPVPILILSTSSNSEDIAYAYRSGADKYLVKPATVEGIKETVSVILEMASNPITNIR